MNKEEWDNVHRDAQWSFVLGIVMLTIGIIETARGIVDGAWIFTALGCFMLGRAFVADPVSKEYRRTTGRRW